MPHKFLLCISVMQCKKKGNSKTVSGYFFSLRAPFGYFNTWVNSPYMFKVKYVWGPVVLPALGPRIFKNTRVHCVYMVLLSLEVMR